MGKKKKVTIGYKYYFDIHMGLGRGPYDAILHIKVGDKTAWEGYESTNARIRINKPSLFGGEKKEGGIDGSLDIMMGQPDQTISTRLASMLGGLVSGFRGVVTLHYWGLVSAMSPYPKPWAIRHTRTTQGWDGPVWYEAKARILLTDPETRKFIYAMNPAHILYELETSRDYGRGKPRAMMDDAAWRSAADQLESEGLGLCLLWKRADSIETFTSLVLAHIGGDIFTSRTTGLRKLALVRNDYDPDTLPHFTPDTGLLDIEEDDNPVSVDTVNEMIVTWRNPIDNSERKARERNLAGVRAAGGRIISFDANYQGAPTYDIALRLAKRDLQAKGVVKRWKLILDRRGRDIEPGAVFKFSDPSRGLSNVIVRAARIIDEGRIEISALLDVFGMPSTTFSAPVDSAWVPPDSTPQPITSRRVTEATWRNLVLNLDAANLDLVDAGSGFVRVLAEKPTALSLSYDIQTRVGSAAFDVKEIGDFAPSCTLAAAVSRLATSFPINTGFDLGLVAVGMAALIDNEWMRIDNIDLDAMTLTVGRGCIDTVPATHNAGATIWFTNDSGGDDPTEYTTGTNVNVRLLTNTSSGQLADSAASIDTQTITARQAKPYPPANFKINGQNWPTDVEGDVVVTWSHRDRILQSDQLIDTTSGNIGPEPGTTYNVDLRNNSSNALITSHTGITATTDTIPETILAALDGVTLRLEVYAVRDGIESLYRQIAVFTWHIPTP